MISNSSVGDKKEPAKVDHFGFVVKGTDELKKDVTIDKSKIKRDNARVEKWRNMMPKLETMIEKRDIKLKTRIRKGIPESFRGKVWPMLAKVPQLKARSSVNYQDLLKQDTPFMEDIIKDVHRTFPNHPFFAEKGGYGQKSLEYVLKGLSITYKEMGYCQGLNFICALLVLYCNDEEAYWIMNSLMITYNLENYYRDLISVKRPLFILDGLINLFFPKIGQIFQQNGIEGVLYSTGWVMTLYTNVLPFNLVVRLFDSFLFEKFKIIYRIGLAIIKIKEKKLLQCKSMDTVLMALKNLNEPEFQDDDAFINIAFGISLTRKDIEKVEAKYVEE